MFASIYYRLCIFNYKCYVLVERSARRELDGYDFVIGMWYLKLALQILGEGRWFVGVWVVQGDEGVGDIPGV